MIDEKEFLGKTLEEAQHLATKYQLATRISSIDGKLCILTRDYNQERINYTVIAGYIVKVSRG